MLFKSFACFSIEYFIFLLVHKNSLLGAIMCHLVMGTCSEECVVMWFRSFANIPECTNPDGTACYRQRAAQSVCLHQRGHRHLSNSPVSPESGFSFWTASAWLKLWLGTSVQQRLFLSQINTLRATQLDKEPGHLFCFRSWLSWWLTVWAAWFFSSCAFIPTLMF